MTRLDWIGANALSGGVLGGVAVVVSGLVAALGPGALIAVSGLGLVVSVDQFVGTVEIMLYETGLTTCTGILLMMATAGIVLSTVGLVKGVRAWQASGSLLSWTPPPLPPDVAVTFRGGVYTAEYLPTERVAYRAEGRTYGQYYGAVRPDSAAMAERLYNVAMYGNDLTQVSAYRIPAGTLVYRGWVEGGTGYQYYVAHPLEAGVELLWTEPLPQYGF
jgi:hypothetical protein